MIQARKISTTTYPIVFFMADSADHVTGKTGLTPTVTISKNGGSFGAASGAVAEIANGFYSLAGNATDRNTLGTLAIHASATGADPADIVVQIVKYDPFAIVDGVWDEVLTGATHNVATSAGRRLRQLASNIIIDGAIVSATSNTITFNGDASTVDGAYDPAIITITSGNGIGQSRLILEYDGDTKTAVVDRDWKVTPAENDEYVIIANPGRESVNEGMAQGGGASTITLNALASSSDDAYIGQVVFLRSGTGADQACRVTDYNGTTKVATVAKNWAVNPDSTTGYVMLPTAVLDLATFIDSIWANDTRTLTQAAIAPQASISAGNLIGVRGDTISMSVTGLGSLANYSALYFTAKTDFGLPDAESTLQIVKKPGGSDGLLWLNAAATTSSWGSITITDANAGNITIALTADASKELSVNLYNYDIQIVRSVGTAVSTMATGRLSIIEDVTRSIS